ncbi:MAG: zinc-ribbon domain-containing protein [Pedosphaera sp.]|nr:zinc-ribbon domain-containing protein [Pedosphaera sp.]
MAPEICPNCGAEVPLKAKACPQCGSDQITGWSDDAKNDALGLPDENFDYDEYVEREFGGKRIKPRGLNWFWWLVAVLLLIAIVFVCVRW